MKKTGVLFIGGGQAAVVLLELFVEDKNIDVLGVSDPNQNAPGIIRAVQLGIPVFAEMDSIIKNPRVNTVVEITGHPGVRRKVLDSLRDDQEIMTASGARILVELTMAQKKTCSQIEEIINVSNQKIDTTSKDIFDVLREMKILAINANVEAARLGNLGKSFAIVADRMSELTHDVQKAIDNITTASVQNRQFLNEFARNRQIGNA